VRLAVWMALGTLLSLGCSHANDFVPLNGAAVQASKPRTIRAPEVRPVAFDGNMIKGAWLGGMVGVAVAAAVAGGTGVDGDVVGKVINDPARFMRMDLLSRMAELFQMEAVVATTPADLQLEVATTEWGIVATRTRHYGVNYRATLRLWDLRAKKLLAQSTCQTDEPRDRPSNPTLDELNSEQGLHRLRAMISNAADHCLTDLRRRALRLR
jgi:hypothetical protein